MAEREAFVSLATNDFYAKGALALGHSIRRTRTSRRLALLVTNSISPEMRRRLQHVWDELVVIEELDSGDAEHLALLSRPELGVTFSKLHAWCLTQYTKCVFLDADTLVLQNVDELFDREELSAAPDIGWPDCFNSGVFVFEPSRDTFNNLVAMARQTGSFDGGDQGLLNMFWSDWATKDIKYHLPFIYNVTPNVAYGYTPAYLQFLSNVKIVHFIGPVKPWQHHYVIENGAIIFSPGTYASQQGAYDFIKRWWEVWTSLEQSDHPGGGVRRRGPPPNPTPTHHHPSHTHSSSSSQSMFFVPHPLSTGHYDLPQDSYFVDAQHSEPFSPPPPSHTQPPTTDANLNPETARFQNLMSIPYSDHHAHTSLSIYSKAGPFGTGEPNGGETRQYNFDTDVSVDQISLRRRLSFPYFYSPTIGRSSSFHSPILHSHHLHSHDIEFPSSLTSRSHHSTHSLYSSSSHSLEPGSTENDDDIIMISRSHDSHVIELPELRRPAVRISDSVLPYLKMSPFSPPTHTTTTQSPITTNPVPTPAIEKIDNITAVGVATPPTQEMGAAGGGEASVSTEDQHRLDFQNGRIDYYGRDSFENIQQRIDAILLEDEEEDKQLGVGDEPGQQEAAAVEAGEGEGEVEGEGVSGETGQEEEKEGGIAVSVPPEGAKAGGE